MGFNLGTLNENEYSNIHDFIFALHTILQYFDYHDKKRILSTSAKPSKRLKPKISKDHIQATPSTSISPELSESSLDNGELNETSIDPSHFKSLSLKGRKLFGHSKSSKEESEDGHQKAVNHKRSLHLSNFMSFGRHREAKEQTQSLSPVASLNSAGSPPGEYTKSSGWSIKTTRRSAQALISHPTNSSSSSGGSNPPFPIVDTNGNDANNSVSGTGTYTMGKKKKYFSNGKADHSSINQNQLTEPEVPPFLFKNPASKAISEGLFFVNEADLPFVPDAVESMITLLDTLIQIYRSILNAVEAVDNMSQPDVNRLDLSLAAIEVILRRTIISEGLVALDSEYIKRRDLSQLPNQIERDIIQVISQPNARHGGKLAGKQHQPQLANPVGNEKMNNTAGQHVFSPISTGPMF